MGNVLAWIWARTVASPESCGAGEAFPLISTYWLCSKKGSEAWLAPIVDKAQRSFHFEGLTGAPKARGEISAGTTEMVKADFAVCFTDAPMTFDDVSGEGNAGRLGSVMLAVVAERPKGAAYSPLVQVRLVPPAKPADKELSREDCPMQRLVSEFKGMGFASTGRCSPLANSVPWWS